MNRSRIHTSEPHLAGAGTFGMPAEGQLPMVADSSAVREVKPARSWWRLGARVVRRALVVVALMTTVPVAIVAVEGGMFARAIYQPIPSMASRRTMAEPVRAFMLPRDPSITPIQAGATLNSIQYDPSDARGYELIVPATRAVLPWHGKTLAPDLFLTARPYLSDEPSSRSILEAVAKGFSPREMEYLRTLATAPVWRDVDLVARAPAVDMVGGRFRTLARVEQPFQIAAYGRFQQANGLASRRSGFLRGAGVAVDQPFEYGLRDNGLVFEFRHPALPGVR